MTMTVAAQTGAAAAIPDLGIMNQMWASHGIGDRQALAIALDEIRHADALGFDSVWIGEHHHYRPDLPYYGRIPAPEIFLSHIAAKTTRISVGTGVRVLSTTPALRTAEEMSLLHLLTDGRTEFGMGAGTQGRARETETREEKYRRFRETLGTVLELLDGAALDGLPPIAPAAEPEIRDKIWVAARDDETLAFIADQGLGLVVGQSEIAPLQAAIVARYRQSGGAGEVRGVRLVHVASTDAEAEANAEAAAQAYCHNMLGRGYHKEATDKGLHDGNPRTAAEMRRQVAFIVGSPDTVVAELNEYIVDTGIDRLDLMVQIPGLETGPVRRSMELICDAVRPRLRFARSGA